MGDIQLWHVSLDRPPEEAERLAAVLAPDERSRANRFRDAALGRRFVVGRATLRQLLGRQLSRDPKEIGFTYGAAGKPELIDLSSHGLHFNLTHSQGVAIIAVSPGRPIGVDVERIRPDFAGEEIAARFFSPREQAMLSALPADQRIESFFRCWTRKEAFIKLLGAGLSFPLDKFDVSLAPGAPAELLALRGESGAKTRWSLREIDAPPEHVAAVAVEGTLNQIISGERTDP